MKVVFLLDNNEYVELAPEKLQIRQTGSGVSSLGYEVTVPVRDEKGEVKLNAEGKPETQTGFRPFVNYAVNLYVPGTSLQEEIKTLKELVKAKQAELKAVEEAGKASEAEAKKAKVAKRRPN